MNDFKREPEPLIQAELGAMERVLRSGWWVLGEEVRTFEKEWASKCGAAHAVGVASGLDALEISLRALRIGVGDEVITTPMTAFATVLGILRSGAQPVLADIDPDTGILDAESAKTCLSDRTRALMAVHLYGRAAPLDAFRELCADAGIALLEDCAQAHGARSGANPVGTVGAVSAWSFYPTKNLGAIGDAGALTTNSEEVASKARCLRNYGQSARYDHAEIGLNSRLDELQAAILRVRLECLDAWIHRRRKVAQQYADGMRNDAVRVLSLPQNPAAHVHHLFVVVCERRDELANHLRARGVETLIHYPVPVHHQEACRTFRLAPRGVPRAEAHARGCLSIPCHPHLTDDEICHVIEAVNAFR